jgi:hypothetical protein
MTDEQYDKTKGRITDLLDKWQGPLGFKWWSISHTFLREEDSEEPDTAARCHTRWQYRKANIRFYMPTCAELDDTELEWVVVHELSHVLVAPIEDYSDSNTAQMSEYAVECVARALLFARNAD